MRSKKIAKHGAQALVIVTLLTAFSNCKSDKWVEKDTPISAEEFLKSIYDNPANRDSCYTKEWGERHTTKEFRDELLTSVGDWGGGIYESVGMCIYGVQRGESEIIRVDSIREESGHYMVYTSILFIDGQVFDTRCPTFTLELRDGQYVITEIDFLQERVEKAVAAIYLDGVIPHYRANKEQESLYKRFCTSEFQNLMAQDNQQNDGEIGFIDHDLWLDAQDWNNDLAVLTTQTYRVVNLDTLWVKVRLRNCGQKNEVMLVVTNENDEWKVDDFPQYRDGEWHSLKAAMQKNLNKE